MITGIKPDNVTEKSKQIINALWASQDGSKTKHITATPALDLLKTMKLVPDFDYPDKLSERLDYMHKSQPALDFIHYSKDGQDFYFVRNTGKNWISRLCSFRQTGKSPELWDPATGDISPITIYKQAGPQIQIPLSLPPFASFFIVFGKKKSGESYTSFISENHPPLLEYTPDGVRIFQNGNVKLTGNGKTVDINHTVESVAITGSWNVSFTKGWGAPEKAVFPELISWTKSENPGIRYYSGSAVYEKSFSQNLKVPKGDRVYLDLGEVSKVAEVWLNGRSLGIVWTSPFRFDVTEQLLNGENNLRIEVINTWSNRIIGDITSPEKFTKTNLNVRGSRELLWTETPLTESGLLGPVVLKTVKVLK